MQPSNSSQGSGNPLRSILAPLAGPLQSILDAAAGLKSTILAFAVIFGVLIVVVFLALITNVVPRENSTLLYVVLGVLVLLLAGSLFLYRHGQQQEYADRQAQREYQLELERLRREQQQADAEPPQTEPKPQASPRLSTDQLQARYFRELMRQCGYLSMASIDPRAARSDAASLELQQVFTELDVSSRPKMDETPEQRTRVRALTARTDGRQNREPALTVLGEHKRLVLLGKPGSGKSTLVNFVTLCLAGDPMGDGEANVARLAEQGWKLPWLLPVRVILRDYAARGLAEGKGLWPFVVDELDAVTLPGGEMTLAAYAEDLADHLRREGGLLLLDGLDEVPDAHRWRERLREEVLDFAADFPNVRILVTGRPYAYTDAAWQLPGFKRVDLLDFDQEQIERYVERWYAATGRRDADLGEQRAAQYAEQLKAEIKRNSNLAELAPRPLLLALMVSLHRWRHGGALPQEREELYDQSVNLLLDLWQRPKQLYDERGEPTGTEKGTFEELGVGRDALRAALSAVAYRAHRDQEDARDTADIRGRALAAALYDAPGRNTGVDLDRIVDYVKERAGLLQELGEDAQGNRIYSFPHRTFQEYLAACHLLEQDTFPDELVQLARAEPERWREAVLLAAARAGSPALVWTLIEALCYEELPPAGTPVDGESWWGAFLAGEVLRERELYEAPSPRHEAKLERVREWLLALVRRGSLPAADRATAADALGWLGDPRAELLNVDDMQFSYVPPGAFWMGSDDGPDEEKPLHRNENVDYGYWLGRYPATVAQFRQFVEESGYEPEDLNSLHDPPTRPVRYVTWYGALAFSRWLDERWRGRLPDGYRVTLPSEAEWEKGARGGLQIPRRPEEAVCAVGVIPETTMVENDEPRRRYPWGQESDAEKANVEASGVGDSSVVGCFPTGAGPYGCHDLSGNLWEWTRSLWGEGYPYVPGDGREDLTAGERVLRVLRGGAYFIDDARCSRRIRHFPRVTVGDNGFRVVVSSTSDL